MRGIWLITEKNQCEYSEGEGDMVNYSIDQCEYSEGAGNMVNYSIDQCE